MKKLKLTTRGRYAVMAMIDLAQSNQGVPLPLAEIAAQGNISISYLEQLVAGLRRHGLVKSYRGPGGGYSLAKPVNDIVISDILLAAEDSTPAKKSKQTHKKAQKGDRSAELWEHIEGMLYMTLKDVSLADVVNNNLSILDNCSKSVEMSA